MADIAATLATDFISAQGWACILIQPATDGCTATISDINARSEPGLRIWLAQKYTDRIMKAFHSRCQQARRSRGGLIVTTDASTVERLIRGFAENYGISVVDDAAIDDQLTMVCKRIEAALERMQKDGSLKMLNRYYRHARDSARTTGTAFPPKYDQWLADRLRPALRAGLC